MAKNKPVSQAERQKIIDLLHEHGGNRQGVAKITGRSAGLILKIARQEGIESVNKHAQEKAAEAAKHLRDYNRLEIIAEILDTGRDLLEAGMDAKDFKDVVTGIAIGIDKHRLETGEATSRSENMNADEAQRRQRIKESLNDLMDGKRLDR